MFGSTTGRVGWRASRTFSAITALASHRVSHALAAELVRLQVDLIVTTSWPAAVAAKQATTTIPIVMVGAGDPVSTGLVASLARPGGNLTGITDVSAETSAKRLELLKEIVPKASRCRPVERGG